MTHLFFKMLKDKMLYDTGTWFGYLNVRDQVNKKKKNQANSLWKTSIVFQRSYNKIYHENKLMKTIPFNLN